MPRHPRNSSRPPGRPAKKRQAEAAIQRAKKTGESLAEAAQAEGIAPSTAFAHKAKASPPAATKAKASKASKPSPSKASPSSPSSPAASPAPAPIELPQGGPSVSTRPDLLELLRRIGKARNAAAWAEVEIGLDVYQRGGEEALAPWLTRPIAAVELSGDELDALREGLAFAVGVARSADAGGPQLRALGIVERLAKSVSVVTSRRPAEPKPDEVQEALRQAADECVEHLMRHHDAAEAEWVALLAEVRTVLGYAAPPVLVRLDALIGAPA